MSAPLPNSLRARFQRYSEEGLSGHGAALRLKLSPATGARWARRIRETGQIAQAPERVVFLDEAAVKTILIRLRACALRGDRLTMDAPFGSWGTQTLIAGLTPDALAAPWMIKGAMAGPAFAAYVREVLLPEIAPGMVVVLDTLATHRNTEAAAALRAHGCWFLYLPPYSPDLNPIEMAFLNLKAHLRRIGARSFTAVFEAIGDICELYSPQECWNYFQVDRYASSQNRNALEPAVSTVAIIEGCSMAQTWRAAIIPTAVMVTADSTDLARNGEAPEHRQKMRLNSFAAITFEYEADGGAASIGKWESG